MLKRKEDICGIFNALSTLAHCTYFPTDDKSATKVGTVPETFDDDIWEMVGEEHEVFLAVLHQLLVVATLVPLHIANKVSAISQLEKECSFGDSDLSDTDPDFKGQSHEIFCS